MPVEKLTGRLSSCKRACPVVFNDNGVWLVLWPQRLFFRPSRHSMNSVWQQLTLENFSLYRWQDASFFYRLVGDPLRAWRKGSLALQWGDAIAGLIVSLVFALAPFVSNDLVGVLLIACAGFWLLLTLSDE